MTRPVKKAHERFFVTQVAKHLGETWDFVGQDRESPDFYLSNGDQRFGLEVCNMFSGLQTDGGSVIKKREARTQQIINTLRYEYEAHTNVPLNVKFVGEMSIECTASIVPRLIEENFSSKPPGYHVIIDKGNGLRAHVTKAFRADWFSVNDRVGWVDCNAGRLVASTIEEKSKKISRYKINTELEDIRLLVVANRIFNSGKLTMEESAPLRTSGFLVVYFFSYPESVICIHQKY